uniref:Nonribosomal peptide synthetase n=1 Tax=Myxococcus virescens TaxID=83456 RepID=A0A1Q1MMB4_9BACT|nr:nonribosomal peptide synthetase [Myxococcus virescens]
MTSEESIEDIYELAPMQHGMLFHALMEPGAGMYVEQLSCEVRGVLPIERWKEAWQHVVARHPILRSGFLWEGLEKPLQVVAVEAEVPWRIEDVRHLAPDAQQRWIEDFLRQDRLQGFDLGTPPLIRCALLRLEDSRYLFVWTYHHLLLDGWCFSIVLREVLSAFEEGVASLPPPARPYRDYISWLQEQDPARAEAFWRERLQGFKQPTPLPFTERQDVRAPAGDTQPEVTLHLSRELTARLTGFAKAHRLTLNTLVQGAWALVQARATGTEDVIFGVTVSGRPADLAGSESIVGLFINTLPLRAQLDGAATVPDFLSGLQSLQSASEPFSHASLADIQRWSDAPHDRPLFESILVFENYPLDASTLLPRSGLTISSVNTHDRISYPLALVAIPGESLELRVMYSGDAFSRPAAERIRRLLETALQSLPHAKTVGDIDLMDEAAQRVLAEWGQNPRAFDNAIPVPALLARAAPDATAVVGPDGRSITYGELNARAERVARHLRQLGAGREQRVGVCIGRSVEMVVALLGVHKAGAAYLPLDPHYPPERLAFIVGDAAPVAILHAGTDPIGETHIPRLDVTRVLGDADAPAVPAWEPARPEDLAYVIYTSGSTGTPKGVLVAHRNLSNLVSWHTEAFGLTAKDRTTQVASVAFDAAVWEIWPTLAAGATLHLAPPELPSAPAELAQWLVAQRISITFLPTVVAEAVLALPWPSDCALRFVLTGGDRLHATPPPGLPFRLVNNYGPTETTVVATSGVVEPDGRQGLPSIGRPVANARVYVLDRQRRPVLPGVIGELYIGGEGVTRGYLNRPELNAERFVPDPFSGVPEARMYASGDFARFLPDGTLAFHGRADRQVQVRGVRVEPGEIEAALASHPGVTAAAVVSEAQRQNGDVRLIAFAASDRGVAPDAVELTRHLATKLPAAMLPSRVVVIDRLPLTPHGKVDTAALEARAQETQPKAVSVAPRTPHEEILAGIWSAVLGQERVGVHDDFFDLGGHSLKATQVIARAREAFGVDLPVRSIFERRTIAQLAEALSGQSATVDPIPRLEQSEDTPVAPGQESLWFIEALGGDSSAYSVPLVLRLQGALDVDVLARTLQHLVERHEALRSTLHDQGGTPVLRVQPAATSVLASEHVSPAHLDARIAAEMAAPFSLTEGPLFRARHFRLAQDSHVLVLNQHHIIADAWSVGILLRELCIVYAALVSGAEPELPALPVRYADWAAWQRQRLESGRLEPSTAFWRDALKGAPTVLPLPTDRPRPERQRFHGKTHAFVLEAPLGQRLEAISRSSGASLFMTLLGAFAAYLGRISGTEEVVIGTPVANRDRHEVEGVVGYFLNTLALRVDLAGDPTFSELLLRVRKLALDAYAHQDVPFEKLVAALELPRGLAHNPLFQVMFVLQGQSGGELQLPGLRAEIQALESSTSKFDLTFFVEPRDGALACSIEYDTDLFDADRIERMAAHLGRLLQAIAEEPELHTSELPLLSNDERRLYADLNRTERRYPGRTLPELFERQAQKTPDAVALEHHGESRTYRQLNEAADALADRLGAWGVAPGVRVAICLDRSLSAQVALLAVLKAGGAYVPLDPTYPPERLRYMLEDAKPRVLLTETKYSGLLPSQGLTQVLLDAPEVPAAKTARPRLEPHHLAYVLYTSGSTGKPKGVAMPHRALVNLIEWQTEHARPLRTLQFAPLNFDVSFQETFATWCSGGTLVLIDEGTRRDPDALAEFLAAARVQRLFLPAVALHHLAQAALRTEDRLPALAEVITAGDQLRITDPIRRWFQEGGKRLHNHYGPTETHVVTAHTLEGDPRRWPGLPSIGRPIANAAVHLLDANQRPVPVGVPGELYLAGPCLADGYLSRPDLTADRFVDLPLSPPVRAYRTGDVGRLMPDGTIEFQGRADDQVKIRGFRVEPGEIERALCAHPDVRDAAVIVDGDATRQKRLVAYVVPETVRTSELPEFLAKDLPEYMVPALFVPLAELPRTPSGKVDRRALPAPAAPARTETAAEPPQTATETAVARAFEQVLGRGAIGRNQDFFQLGGHSLLAMQVVARIRGAVDNALRVSDLFENPTIAALSRVLDERRDSQTLTLSRIEPAPEGAAIPLTFSQERLWFLDQLYPGSAAYNLPMALRLTGTLNVDAFRASLADIVQRHPVLGVRFVEREGGVWQEPRTQHTVPFEQVALGPTSPEALRGLIDEEAARPFDLSNGPLFRAKLFQLDETEHVVVATLHHTVGDGWSISVLARDLTQLYAGRILGKPAALPALAVGYRDYAYQQRRSLQNEALEQRLDHWRQLLRGAPTALDLPTDRPRPAKASMRGANERITLGRELRDAIETLSLRTGGTSFMVLLSGFAAYLARITGQDDVVIGTPVANRDHAELEPLIGFFVGTVPLRVDLSGDPTFEELLARARKTALDAFAHQDVPLEKIVEAANVERSLSHAPLFQVMLALQNTPAGQLSLPGLTLESLALELGTSKFDLSLSFEPTHEGLTGVIEYSTDLFDAWRIQAMVRQFTGFLTRLVTTPAARLSDVDLLSDAERTALMPRAPEPMPRLPAVHEVIAGQARKTPEAIAVEAEDGSLTYAALEARANAVAQALVDRGVAPGALVALAVERSVEMMAGLLGILKAGAAYVPLDPAYPRERLAFMLEDSGARVVITQAHLAATFAGADVLVLTEAARDAFEARSGDLAYCLFTSGSTGQPKGVLIEHISLANHMAWMAEALPLGPEDRVLQRTSLSFDASVWELFAPLMAGARLVLAPKGLTADTEHLVRVLQERGITVLQLVPSLLTALVEEPGLTGASTLRRVCVGGEPLPSATVRKLLDRVKAEVWNFYGPTEATIEAVVHRCEPDAVGAHGPTEPIGRPILRMEALVLDAKLRPVPAGVPGELYLAGPGLARGYLNRPELTTSRFIEHTFPGGPTLRMYRTGDVVRRKPDGTLLFVGRADRQVKVRGHRIELGEVEAAIARHASVRDAAALVRGTGGDARLVAFVTYQDGAERVEAPALRAFVERQLTASMVPGQFVFLEDLPHAPNGKVDYRELGALPIDEARVTRLEGLPRDAMELETVRLFEEVLGMRAVGIHDSFFDLGGHSMLALKLKLAVEKRLNRPFPLVSLFQNPTPAQLAKVLRTGESKASPLVPLTPAAHAMLASPPEPSTAPRTPVLYLVPGGGSTPFYLLSLARHLDGVAVFGLQPQGLDGEAPPHETVEDIATWYADAMAAVQPQGPYNLGGHSLGGHIAYELAQELQSRGRDVSLVAMLDTVAPFPEATQPLSDGWDTAQWMAHLGGVMEGFFNVKLDLVLPELQAMDEAQRLRLFVTRLQAVAVLPEGAQPSHVQGILNVARAHDGLNYRPRRTQHVPLVVFRAEDRSDPHRPELDALLEDDTLGWGRFTRSDCASHPVPGTHLSLIRDPHAAVLARHLLPRLLRPAPAP